MNNGKVTVVDRFSSLPTSLMEKSTRKREKDRNNMKDG